MKLNHLFMGILITISLSINLAFAELVKTNKHPQEKPAFVELLPKDFKPAFTRETVIKLNAIVHRSYSVINEYDTIVDQTFNTLIATSEKNTTLQSQSMAKEKIKHLRHLEDRSNSALSDMVEAVSTLQKSGEEYNKAVLAGMVTFVKDVQAEVTQTSTKLHILLNNKEH